jgi:hypothetical protein
MKKSFLFKRGKYYHLQYFDEYEQDKKESLQVKPGRTALKFSLSFERSQ